MSQQEIFAHIEQNTIDTTIKAWDSHWKETLISPADLEEGLKRDNVLLRFLKRAGSFETIYRIIRKELLPLFGKLILEAGSGSGAMSLKLAECGARMILLDTSETALRHCAQMSDSKGIKVYPVRASILALPFKAGVFQAVFNVGVLDNFQEAHRSRALSEVQYAAGEGAKVIVASNSSASFIHRRAMRYALKHGRWKYGFKDALSTLRDCWKDERGSWNLREIRRGFLCQFEFLRYFLPQKSEYQKIFYRLFHLFTFAFSFLNYFPGQYLISIFERVR
jgi:SAM-dependent methyltransferase